MNETPMNETPMTETVADLEYMTCELMNAAMQRLTTLKQGNPYLDTDTKRSAAMLETMVQALRAVILDESMQIF